MHDIDQVREQGTIAGTVLCARLVAYSGHRCDVVGFIRLNQTHAMFVRHKVARYVTRRGIKQSDSTGLIQEGIGTVPVAISGDVVLAGNHNACVANGVDYQHL